MTTEIVDRIGFTASRQALADALAIIGRVAGAQSGYPILSGVLLEVKGNALTLGGTDRDLTAVVEIPVESTMDGVAVVPARLLAEVVKSLNADVTIAVADDEVRVSSGRATFALRTFAPGDFPNLPPEPTGKAVTLEVAGFAEALRQVLVAAGSDDNRPMLTGVLMAAEPGGMRLVATDSYRLAFRDLSGDTELVKEGDKPLVVPARGLNELVRVLGTTGELTVYPGEHDITFVVGNIRLTSRLIEGDFPNYRGLIPADPPNVLRANKAQLAEAVKRVKLLARDNTTPLRLSLVDGGLFGMKVVAVDVGEAAEEVDATYTGVEQVVAFNPAFLLDGIEAAPGEEIELRMQDAIKPALLGAVGAPEFVYLCMPIRV